MGPESATRENGCHCSSILHRKNKVILGFWRMRVDKVMLYSVFTSLLQYTNKEKLEGTVTSHPLFQYYNITVKHAKIWLDNAGIYLTLHWQYPLGRGSSSWLPSRLHPPSVHCRAHSKFKPQSQRSHTRDVSVVQIMRQWGGKICDGNTTATVNDSNVCSQLCHMVQSTVLYTVYNNKTLKVATNDPNLLIPCPPTITFVSLPVPHPERFQGSWHLLVPPHSRYACPKPVIYIIIQ